MPHYVPDSHQPSCVWQRWTFPRLGVLTPCSVGQFPVGCGSSRPPLCLSRLPVCFSPGSSCGESCDPVLQPAKSGDRVSIFSGTQTSAFVNSKACFSSPPESTVPLCGLQNCPQCPVCDDFPHLWGRKCLPGPYFLLSRVGGSPVALSLSPVAVRFLLTSGADAWQPPHQVECWVFRIYLRLVIPPAGEAGPSSHLLV